MLGYCSDKLPHFQSGGRNGLLIIISPTGYDDLNVSIADQHLVHTLHGVRVVNMLRVDEQKKPWYASQVVMGDKAGKVPGLNFNHGLC